MIGFYEGPLPSLVFTLQGSGRTLYYFSVTVITAWPRQLREGSIYWAYRRMSMMTGIRERLREKTETTSGARLWIRTARPNDIFLQQGHSLSSSQSTGSWLKCSNICSLASFYFKTLIFFLKFLSNPPPNGKTITVILTFLIKIIPL